jgi:hypothetical protein
VSMKEGRAILNQKRKRRKKEASFALERGWNSVDIKKDGFYYHPVPEGFEFSIVSIPEKSKRIDIFLKQLPHTFLNFILSKRKSEMEEKWSHDSSLSITMSEIYKVTHVKYLRVLKYIYIYFICYRCLLQLFLLLEILLQKRKMKGHRGVLSNFHQIILPKSFPP